MKGIRTRLTSVCSEPFKPWGNEVGWGEGGDLNGGPGDGGRRSHQRSKAQAGAEGLGLPFHPWLLFTALPSPAAPPPPPSRGRAALLQALDPQPRRIPEAYATAFFMKALRWAQPRDKLCPMPEQHASLTQCYPRASWHLCTMPGAKGSGCD